MSTYVQFLEGDKTSLTETLATSTWTNNLNNLTVAFSGSSGTSLEQVYTSATSSKMFYIDVFQTASHDASAEVQYAVAYGHRIGCGSIDFTNDVGSFGIGASKCIYSQYQQLIYGDDITQFKFGEHPSEHIYVINVERARLKHNLKPGSLNLKLSASVVGQEDWTGYYEGQAFNIELTDDSVTAEGSAENSNIGRRYNIVSGANGIRSGSNPNQVGGSASFGHFYPDAGIIVLNPDAFGFMYYPDAIGGLRPQTNIASTTNIDKNNEKLFQAISGAGYFIVDSEEDITSQYFFARARNNEFNYTNNPTFVDSTGTLKYTSMINNPKTYITTVGLYNANLDLVAVAKLSQPISKDKTKEALIRIKLDY